MRVLAIETTTLRGSIALCEHGAVVASDDYRKPQAHAELILPLVEATLRRAGWARGTIERIGVGVGPGSFVGLRVGIALAQGLALGLGCPVVGVPSLRAMTRAVRADREGARVALVDARRSEVFLTAVAPSGKELLPVRAVARSAVSSVLDSLETPGVLLGEVAPELGLSWPVLRAPDLDLPHARWIGILAGELDPSAAPPEPCYVRGAGATLPNLPPSPLRA